MGSGAPSVVVVGDVLLDVVVRPDGPVAMDSDTPSTIGWRQGGSAANTAVWLARGGTDTTLVGRVGDDLAGRALREDLQRAKVRTLLGVDSEAPTGTVVALIAGTGRDMYTSRGAAAGLVPGDLPVGWTNDVHHLHLSGYVLLSPQTRPAGLAALAQAVSAGMTISVDPSSAVPLAAVGGQTFLSWLPAGTLLKANRAEAEVLSGSGDPLTAAAVIAGWIGQAVVTDGADAVVWADGTDTLVRRVDAQPHGGIDPVGAGDAFMAGLLAARLRGEDPGAQLDSAILVATQAIILG